MGKAFDKLTSKQKTFVMEYMADMDRIRALKEAGYRGSRDALHTMGSKLLKKESIQKAISEIGNPLFEEQQITVEGIAKQLSQYVYRDIGDLLDDNNQIRSVKDLPAEVRQCIESLEIDESYDPETGELIGQKFRVRLVSKIKALELAMKYLNMLQPNTQVNINNTMNLNWDDLYNEEVNPNTVEERVKLLEAQTVDGEVVSSRVKD